MRDAVVRVGERRRAWRRRHPTDRPRAAARSPAAKGRARRERCWRTRSSTGAAAVPAERVRRSRACMSRWVLAPRPRRRRRRPFRPCRRCRSSRRHRNSRRRSSRRHRSATPASLPPSTAGAVRARVERPRLESGGRSACRTPPGQHRSNHEHGNSAHRSQDMPPRRAGTRATGGSPRKCRKSAAPARAYRAD